ncbi:amidohydrolase family protein [Paenibacillus alginolyticus]|uniref:Amidohydrolase family protein n=1 Tax=Paenibacillus alginolyticus TaxID=59839 RepID=A0ABT4GPQ0_9BACL|nr:amidohydrolase family protein [Paenibacillus alginolyticus]MCY9698172.1 amidohydrolase family protein [Paenibacillus alginolyticus]MEC0146718.1 amidohydrolase family protein [Paenibacillus alginolyticus]
MKYIDCDVHHNVPDIEAIFPYLPRKYKEQVEIFGIGIPMQISSLNGGVNGRRADSYPSNGKLPGTNLPLMASQHLDPFNIEYGILTGEFQWATVTPDTYYSAALCSALNDYTIEHWLEKDARLRGSIYVPIHDPVAAVKEIERLGSHPLMVQVLAPAGTKMPYGQKFYHPIYEACERHNLPFTIHVGSEGHGINPSPTGVGYPSYYVEFRALRQQVYMAHMASFVFEGVFELFPKLKVVFLEAGVFWIAPYLWHLDQDWRGLRYQTPWVQKKPSEYFQTNMYVGSQPVEEVPNPNLFMPMMESVYARDRMLFASDYPHWDYDSPKLAFPKMDKELAENIFYNNAADLYGLPKNEVKGA